MTNTRIFVCEHQWENYNFCLWCGLPLKLVEKGFKTCSARMFHMNVLLDEKCGCSEDCDFETRIDD